MRAKTLLAGGVFPITHAVAGPLLATNGQLVGRDGPSGQILCTDQIPQFGVTMQSFYNTIGLNGDATCGVGPGPDTCAQVACQTRAASGGWMGVSIWLCNNDPTEKKVPCGSVVKAAADEAFGKCIGQATPQPGEIASAAAQIFLEGNYAGVNLTNLNVIVRDAADDCQVPTQSTVTSSKATTTTAASSQSSSTSSTSPKVTLTTSNSSQATLTTTSSQARSTTTSSHATSTTMSSPASLTSTSAEATWTAFSSSLANATITTASGTTLPSGLSCHEAGYQPVKQQVYDLLSEGGLLPPSDQFEQIAAGPSSCLKMGCARGNDTSGVGASIVVCNYDTFVRGFKSGDAVTVATNAVKSCSGPSQNGTFALRQDLTGKVGDTDFTKLSVRVLPC